MNSLDGALSITVFAQGAGVEQVKIDSPRKNVAPVFVGRTLAEANMLAKNLFSLCPAAQSLAVQAAGEAAREEVVAPHELELRHLRLLAERYVEMLRASVLDWPSEGAPDADGIAALRETMRNIGALLVSGEGDLERVERAAERLGLRDFSSGDRVFARQWAEVVADQEHWALGQISADFLRPSDDGAVAGAMTDPNFCLAPRLPGRSVETGACARRAGADFINNLSGRLATRFADMAATLDAIAALVKGGVANEDLPVAKGTGPGQGYAMVDSARGRLYHHVRLDDAGRIADYSIVAPTEWNFHPEGPFVRLLRGARLGLGAAARRRVERLAFVFDPCIGVGVEIRETLHA